MNETVLTDPSKFFWLWHGRSLTSLRELAETVSSLDDQEYSSYVNSQKNDFANWAYGVFHDEEAAALITGSKSKHELGQRLKQAFKEAEWRKTKAALAGELTEKGRRAEKAVGKTEPAAAKKAAPQGGSRLEQLQERERALRLAISDARKKGHNPNLAEFVLRRFKSKLAYAQASGLETDLDKAEAVLHETEAELQDALAEQRIDVKREVDLLAGVHS